MGLADDRARDVGQNIFVALLRKLPTFELDRSRGRFRTWLWRVTRNAVIDAARDSQQQDHVRREGGARTEAEHGNQQRAGFHGWNASKRTRHR